MNTFNPRDFQLDTEYRNRNFSQNNQPQANESANEDTQRSFDISRRLVSIILMVICIVGMLVTIPSTQAQAINDEDASGDPKVELGLMMGAYYFNQERYEEAIEQFQIAIDGMPEVYFEIAPEQAIVFWQMAEALEQAGYLPEALISYQRYLEFAGDGATDFAITYVTELETQIETINA